MTAHNKTGKPKLFGLSSHFPLKVRSHPKRKNLPLPLPKPSSRGSCVFSRWLLARGNLTYLRPHPLVTSTHCYVSHGRLIGSGRACSESPQLLNCPASHGRSIKHQPPSFPRTEPLLKNNEPESVLSWTALNVLIGRWRIEIFPWHVDLNHKTAWHLLWLKFTPG